MENRDEKIASG